MIYLGSVMAILYYYGLTQWFACKLGWLMQISMGTTAIETLNAAANIFLDGVSSDFHDYNNYVYAEQCSWQRSTDIHI